MTRLLAALLALDGRAALFAILAALPFLALGFPSHALAALTLTLTHDLSSRLCRRKV